MKKRISRFLVASLLILPTLGPRSSTLVAQSAWNVNGNLVTPGQFLGSTNNQPLELRAGGTRVLRLEPDSGTSFAGNLIGGYTNNLVE